MHFINCHGDTAKSEFYGQQGDDYPTSLDTKSTIGEILDGPVASAECCYGVKNVRFDYLEY